MALTALRAASLELGPVSIGLPWLCAIHHTLFQDIYPWAANCAASIFINNDIRFCHFAYLETEGNALIQRLEEEDYLRDLPFEPFCDKLAAFYFDINMLHPFRGGGTVTRSGFSLNN